MTTRGFDKVKAERLERYQYRTPQVFAFFEGWDRNMADLVQLEEATPDQDGDLMLSGASYELIADAPVSVFIAHGTDTKTALRLLKKIRDAIKSGCLYDRQSDMQGMREALLKEVCPNCGHEIEREEVIPF